MSAALAEITRARRACSYMGRCRYGCQHGHRCLADEAKLLGHQRHAKLARMFDEFGPALHAAELARVRAAAVEPDPPAAAPAPRSAADVARAQGFTGDTCSACGGGRMRRNGACQLCADCGETTGCS
jgi:hypothetical protein